MWILSHQVEDCLAGYGACLLGQGFLSRAKFRQLYNNGLFEITCFVKYE